MITTHSYDLSRISIKTPVRTLSHVCAVLFNELNFRRKNR